MTTPSNLLETGLKYHQAGNLQQAEQIYRRVLQEQPHNPEALHLLGILAHQAGASDVAIACISEAIQRDPQAPIFHNNLGEAYRAAGKLDKAIGCYNRAIQLKSDYFEAYFNLGNTLQAQGHLDEAIDRYRRTLELNPRIIQAYNNLGAILRQQGKFDEAIACYQQAIQTDPSYTRAYNNLGVAWQAKGKFDEAIASYGRAIQIDPNYADAYNNLGTALQENDDPDGAIAAYRQAITLKADYAEAHYNLGNALKAKGKFQLAIDSYKRAISLAPTWAGAYLTLGNVFRELGCVDEAIDNYQRALQHQPDLTEAYWNQQLLLPLLYERTEEISLWRQRFRENLNTLIEAVSVETPEGKRRALEGISCTTNFFLQYQGCNDVEIQSQYGRLVHRVMAANFPQWDFRQGVRGKGQEEIRVPSSKVRIGFVSHYFREHTVGILFLGWLKHLDRISFEVYCYYTDKSQDSITDLYRSYSDTFHHIPTGFQAVCGQIFSDRPDVLVFTDIGMDARTDKIAGLRLAPLQCAAWGHPITSGLPTIDYYLTSDLMEPENAQAHYTETLVRLPGIGISYPKPAMPATGKSRADLLLRDDAVVYLSCQSSYKYLPQYDYIFAEIARRVPTAQFAFLASPNGDGITAKLQQRLQRAFANLGLDSEEYCVILPRLTWEDYLNLNLASNIFLDTPGWSGGNTTLEAIASNLPIVTLPGEFMRGRHAYAMLRVLEVPETIAKDEGDYIEIATRLGMELQWRDRVVNKMQLRHNVLYDDLTCVRALEEFLKQQAPAFLQDLQLI